MLCTSHSTSLSPLYRLARSTSCVIFSDLRSPASAARLPLSVELFDGQDGTLFTSDAVSARSTLDLPRPDRHCRGARRLGVRVRAGTLWCGADEAGIPRRVRPSVSTARPQLARSPPARNVSLIRVRLDAAVTMLIAQCNLNSASAVTSARRAALTSTACVPCYGHRL